MYVKYGKATNTNLATIRHFEVIYAYHTCPRLNNDSYGNQKILTNVGLWNYNVCSRKVNFVFCFELHVAVSHC